MPFLVRRLSRSKWESFDFDHDDNPPADAITNCLKTFENELSTWKVENTDELEKAILCLVTGPKQENLGAIHIIYFDIEKIEHFNLTVKESPGDTVISAYQNNHIDITSLNYESLGSVKDLILECLRSGFVKTITKGEVKKILLKAVDSGILDKSLLHEKYKETF